MSFKIKKEQYNFQNNWVQDIRLRWRRHDQQTVFYVYIYAVHYFSKSYFRSQPKDSLTAELYRIEYRHQ